VLANLSRRLADQAGAGQAAFIGAVLALCVSVGAVIALASSATSSASPVDRDIAAQSMALAASQAASRLAAGRNGSFVRVGRLSLHNGALVPFAPSAARPWLSAASGTAQTFSLTVTMPSGDTYTITRAADGALSGTCHVTASRARGSGCLHTDAGGAGVW